MTIIVFSGIKIIQLLVQGCGWKRNQEIMENLNLSLNVAKLWNIHQQRENLYKQTMTLENLGPLRKLCSQGYMVSILFKKEINWIYDQIKCTLSEGDISKRNVNQNINPLSISSDNESIMTNQLIEQEEKIIKMYKLLLNDRDITYEAEQILNEHLHKLADLHRMLIKAVAKNQVNEPVLRQAVA
jgi:hypothetical protein